MAPVTSWASDGIPSVSYALTDHTGRVLASRASHTVYYSASTVKLGVMLAAVLAAERGEFGGAGLGAELECRHEFVCGEVGRGHDGDDVVAETFVLDPDDRDAAFPPDGASASVAELVRMMIVRSSNEATNVLFDRLGAARIAEAFALCGAASTRMERRIGDPCAVRAGLTNETCAVDLVAIVRALVTGAVTNAEHAEWMRGVLAGQEHPRIGAVLPSGVPWGSKSGDVPGIEHDVAFIGDGDARRYLAVCTRGFEPEQGREVIRAVAGALLTVAG